jgi:hypothetical protein
MIARIRGEHDTRAGRWPPRNASQADTPPQTPTESLGEPEPEPPTSDGQRLTQPRARPRPVARALRLLAMVGIGYIATTWCLQQLSQPPAAPRLPATPRAWLDAYEAAAIDKPSRVCSQLFTPALATLYAHAAHRSCTRYFKRITSSSVTIRRILREGGTAVLELRQTLNHAAWAVVLNRESTGWQAVDLLSS